MMEAVVLRALARVGLGLGFALVAGVCSAKNINPAEILGRDLNIPGLGWAGHVGISTGAYSSPNDMSKTADLVIEALNESPAIQLNYISNFKTRSRFWGSRYGIANGNRAAAFGAIMEANHQRWWCPSYTSSTAYTIGVGDVGTGAVSKCGQWRCDTFAYWSFYAVGYDLVRGWAILPTVIYNAFPYPNAMVETRTLDDVSPDSLNTMSFEEFELIADVPLQHETHAHRQAEVRFVHAPDLNDIKRGVFIDRLAVSNEGVDFVGEMLNLYQQDLSVELKKKVISGMMHYEQAHSNSARKEAIRAFFVDVIRDPELRGESAFSATRGFVDMHSSDEVIASLQLIDNACVRMGHYNSIMLKNSLIHKSKALRAIYVPSILAELKSVNSRDLDGYFYGPLAYAKDFKLEPSLLIMVQDYKRLHGVVISATT